jgi:hypothetical protein
MERIFYGIPHKLGYFKENRDRLSMVIGYKNE